MRIMGLDFGSKTVGVAVSDSLLLTAQGLEIIRRKEENKLRQTFILFFIFNFLILIFFWPRSGHIYFIDRKSVV